MNTLISLLSIVLSIGSIVCFVIVLIKLFSSEGIWMGLLGLICGLYALYWGYKNREKHNLQNVVTIWAILIALSVLINLFYAYASS